LRFTIERALHGQGEQLNQYLIGVEVFDRNATYDPTIDPIVRVEAARLRTKLNQYYENEGLGDPTIISYPKGGYAPTFHERPISAAEPSPTGPQTLGKGMNHGVSAPVPMAYPAVGGPWADKGAPPFDNVVVAGPNKASAFLGLAHYFYLLGVDGSMAWKQAMDEADAAVKKALAYDNTNAEAHAMLGLIRSLFHWDWSAAEQELKRAIELKPNYLPAHQWYAQTVLGATGRLDDALSEIRRAVRLDPRASVTNAILVSLLYMNGEYDQAIEQGWRTIEMDPICFWAYKDIGLSFGRKAMFDEGIGAMEKADVLSGGDSATLGPLGYLYAMSGRRNDAEKVLDQLERKSKRTHVSPCHCAFVCAGLGDWDRLFEWLNRAYDERCIWLNSVKVEPLFISAHTDPRFTALLKNMGLQS
jgi:tetratricopeptide (TPR) repeat protein